MAPSTSPFLQELSWRGLIHQTTGDDALAQHLTAVASPAERRAYVGFDPTADSLTVGNLVPILLLARFQRAGHTPVVLSGGGTGLIGDPSGKSAERQLRTEEQVRHNVDSQRRIFSRVIDFSERLSNRAVIVNNLDWLGKISYIEALRDIGKHFSVNMMMQKESVRERLTGREQGISYTEFSYMILQAYDFLHLYRTQNITVQMGGSDQWGNIVTGTELIRKVYALRGEHPEVHGLTTPLITKSDGGKFGKSESGAVWLTADRTSPYAFYQFWLNTADADVVRFLKTFTFLPQERIDELSHAHATDPGGREAHRELARHMTDMLHGVTERELAETAAAALFSGDVKSLPATLLDEVLASAPTTRHDKSLLAGEGLPLVDVLPLTSLAGSKSEARRHIEQKSVSVNGDLATLDTRLTTASLLHGSVIALRRGKKNWHVTRWE